MLADNGDKDGFKLYTGLPHLLTAPINETTRTLSALRWANKEMERRYEILESAGVEDFAEYRQKIPLQLRMDDPLPVVLVVIDEIADLMSDYGDDADKLLRRLAMMSCGVGIHLVLSTASYEPRILRATLSANIPSVLCFSVDTAEVSDLFVYDSGAEELIGKGSALVTTPNIFPATPVYTQGITTQEVKQCVLNVKRKYGAVDEDGIDLKKLSDYKFELFSFEEDELYQDAKEAVIEAGKASTSYLQRRLRVGYSRAARLIDMLEERGVIGPQDGSSPREVLE
jgi:S-DNA-T family DNA segregation ATPase FtsK/SpoIIIE